MIVRYGDERDDEDQRGLIVLFIKGRFDPDAVVDIEELIELRCEIDRFLFLDHLPKMTSTVKSGASEE